MRSSRSAARPEARSSCRCGSGRERGQAGAPLHRLTRGHRLRRRVPGDVAGADDDITTHPYKTGLSPFARVYRRRISTGVPIREGSRCARAHVLHACLGGSSLRSSSRHGKARAGSFPQRRVRPRAKTHLRQARDRSGADEVQTGFGQTERMFMEPSASGRPAHRREINCRRSPLSGVIGRASIMDAPHAGRSVGRSSGTRWRWPLLLRCLTSSRKKGSSSARNRRRRYPVADVQWQERWSRIGDVRGLGAMLAIELIKTPQNPGA